MRRLEPIKTVELERVRLYSQSIIDAELLGKVKTMDSMMLLEHEDAYARRHILDMFGKRATFEFSAPETWWQHLKLALRTRWPRLFRWLVVRYRVARLDTGAVMCGLPEPRGDRFVLPYFTPPSFSSYRDPFEDDEP